MASNYPVDELNSLAISPSKLEGSELDSGFKLVSDTASSFTGVSDNLRLSLYGCYKQVTIGSCNTKRPGIFDQIGRAKWDAWNKLAGVSPVTAKRMYIETALKIDPDRVNRVLAGGEGAQGGEKPSFNFTEKISSLAGKLKEEDLKDGYTTIHDFCKIGDLYRLKMQLTDVNKNSIDELGMSPLHWACDRGNIQIVEYLLDMQVDINITTLEQQTPLHIASGCGHIDLVVLLLSRGANPKLKDEDQQTPKQIAYDKETELCFNDT
ncbi:Acyl-CoA-binding domain-containing protein 6-like [Oopsacas minuta]|uniref:Acyl-CoA-binding domain-containing protein 6 n=1 Tax=Oopsacas minuta TaxID=111878 RepID=A0AAV7K852_9METZ|nr:Acyl-CoA-binding domain-containing protein 6-like [Oopsacas minuta]